MTACFRSPQPRLIPRLSTASGMPLRAAPKGSSSSPYQTAFPAAYTRLDTIEGLAHTGAGVPGGGQNADGVAGNRGTGLRSHRNKLYHLGHSYRGRNPDAQFSNGIWCNGTLKCNMHVRSLGRARYECSHFSYHGSLLDGVKSGRCQKMSTVRVLTLGLVGLMAAVVSETASALESANDFSVVPRRRSRRTDYARKGRVVEMAENNWLLSLQGQERPEVVYIHGFATKEYRPPTRANETGKSR
jgi:hypothetical protein